MEENEIMKLRFPCGEFNCEMPVKATKEGLEINEFEMISWDEIREAWGKVSDEGCPFCGDLR